MYINEITATTITTNTAETNQFNNPNQDSQIINIEKLRKSPSTSSDSGVNCNNEEDTSSLNYLFNGVNNNNNNQSDNDNKINDNEIELKNINFSTTNTTTENNNTHKNNDVNSKENDNQIMMNVISKNLNNSNRNNRSHKSITSSSSSSSSSNSSICSSNNSNNNNNNNNNNFNYNLNNNNYNNVQQNDNNNSEIVSPTTSVNSNRISIVSIDDDDIESSVIDSDDDDDFDIDDLNDPDIIPIGNNRNYIIKKLSERIDKNDDGGIIVINQNNDNNILSTLPEVRDDGGICLPNDSENIIKNVTANNDGKPQIGSIAVQNSTDITFGNKTFYQGPVTIKQFVLEKKTEDTKICVNNKVTVNGKDNFGFDCDAELGGETNQRNNNRYNLNTTRGYLSQKLNLNRKTSTILGAAILFILLICAVGFILQAILHNSSNTNSDGRVLRMVTRDEWIAQPAMGELRPLNLPTHRVIIAHTATEGCNTQASCVFRVRYIQTFHIESRNFDDIAYNFLVGGDGSVYEGRGWDKEGAHTKGYNVDSICVAFIGTFIQIEPNEKQLKAAKMIIEEGVRLGKIVPDYKLYGHRQLMASESPGEALYKIIQKWSHWSNEID